MMWLSALCLIFAQHLLPASARTCTCAEAAKDPLAQEYAYRLGICPGSSPDLGPGVDTTACMYAVHEEYNGPSYKFNGAEPQTFNESTAHSFPVFDGISYARVPAGVVNDAWACQQANGCGDCDPKRTPRQCSDERGFAYLWVPNGARSTTPRILYVHGGSWLSGSPDSASYAPFCAMIAKTTGMPVLAIDYTLAPVGNFSVILSQIGHATHWLATHNPIEVIAGRPEARPLAAAPPLFIAGDSSGGGSATSALLAQASGSLPGAKGAVFAGGVLFSPWLNLPCDTPSYVSQIFKKETMPTRPEHIVEHCELPGLTQHKARVSIGGDVAFAGYPASLSASFARNGETYVGNPALVHDPLASPMSATRAHLANMVPLQLHVGLGEVLAAENAIFATKMAEAGAACELHSYDAMWHVFSMYYEGCEHPKISKLLFAYSSLNLTASFFRRLAAANGQVHWQQNGAPYSWTHYEYPRGVDSAMAAYHSAAAMAD